MRKYKFGKMLLPVVLIALLGVVSCQKDNDELAPMRMFTPAGDIKAVSGETKVTLTWDPSLYKKSTDTTIKYSVQLSDDSTFTTVMNSYQIDTTGITFTDDLLAVRKKYFIRVKALGADTTLNSHWATSSSFSIRGEQYFVALTSDDIIDRAVRIKWRNLSELDKLVITPKNGAAIEIALTSTDNISKSKIVDGLTPNTQYEAEIFQGAKSKGYLNFNTATTLAGELIDLRGILDRPSVLADTLPLIPSGSTVILRRGLTYNIATTVNLDRSVKIISGPDLTNPEQAVIYFTSNFNVLANSSIDKIEFNSVTLRGSDYSGKYVFNVSNACTIGAITFESCKAEIFRGLARLQTAVINVSSFTINNSIVDSIGNYGVVNVDNVNCKINDIAITNSTIYKVEKIVVSKQNSNSVLIENCTINEAPLGGGTSSNYFVDYRTSGTNNITNGVRFANNIIGGGKPTSTGNIVVRPYIVNANTTVGGTGNYSTSDYSIPTGVTNFTGLTTYSGSSISLWQSPATGDFKIKDASFAGKATAGDPRWR